MDASERGRQDNAPPDYVIQIRCVGGGPWDGSEFGYYKNLPSRVECDGGWYELERREPGKAFYRYRIEPDDEPPQTINCRCVIPLDFRVRGFLSKAAKWL